MKGIISSVRRVHYGIYFGSPEIYDCSQIEILYFITPYDVAWMISTLRYQMNPPQNIKTFLSFVIRLTKRLFGSWWYYHSILHIQHVLEARTFQYDFDWLPNQQCIIYKMLIASQSCMIIKPPIVCFHKMTHDPCFLWCSRSGFPILCWINHWLLVKCVLISVSVLLKFDLHTSS